MKEGEGRKRGEGGREVGREARDGGGREVRKVGRG